MISPGASSGDGDGPRQRSRGNSVEDLPDLSDRIMSMGLYEEYQKFRQGYMSWRGGSTRGSVGEHTAEALAESADRDQARRSMQRWYPTYRAWMWRRTGSYWIAVFFLEGSLLFLLGSGFSWAFACGFRIHEDAASQEDRIKSLTAWPTLFGGILFSVAGYLMCLETANVTRPPAQWHFWPFRLNTVFGHLDSCSDSREITRNPYYAAFSYFVGTSIYPVSLVTALFNDVSPTAELLLGTIPCTAGGLLFALGGLFECIENRVFCSRPDGLAWWAALMNFIGGILFALGGGVLFCSASEAALLSDIAFTIGSGIYVVGSILNVLMWKDEQFGLSYMPVLKQFSSQVRVSMASSISDTNEGSGPSGPAPVFSLRGVLFIHLYCVISVLAVFDFCLSLSTFIEHPNFFFATRAMNDGLPFVLLHMILLLHSAVVKTPTGQPFHALLMAIRVTAFAIGTNSVLSFLISVMPVGGPIWRPPPPLPPPHHSMASAVSQRELQ